MFHVEHSAIQFLNEEAYIDDSAYCFTWNIYHIYD